MIFGPLIAKPPKYAVETQVSGYLKVLQAGQYNLFIIFLTDPTDERSNWTQIGCKSKLEVTQEKECKERRWLNSN